METNILLDSGTNELEVLEFKVGSNYYGINVAKIREILPYTGATPIPNSHPCIEGIFMPRDTMITSVSLSKALSMDVPTKDGDMMIITNFNQLNVGFHVNEVLGIHRVSWESIITPDATLNNKDQGVATGIIKFDDKLIVVLDFEKIVSDISPETGLKLSDIKQFESRGKNAKPILIAEDSPLLSKLIQESIQKSGYTNVTMAKNGKEAWDILNGYEEKGILDESCSLIITDIEMPVMDGHRLTKLVKSSDTFKHIPLIIFSSLVNDEMRAKGISLGADAQLSKPEIGDLVGVIDSLIDKRIED